MGNVLTGLIDWYKESKNKGYKLDKKKTKKNKKLKKLKNKKENKKNEKDRSIFSEDTVIDLIAPDGVNPNPLSYFVINDGGEDVYIRSFYIDKLPRRATFVKTWEEIFNFSDSTVSVFIDPMTEGKAIRELDKEIKSLDSENIIAKEKKDRNRQLKVGKKLQEAEGWLMDIDTGENIFFEVGFIITIFADSLEELDIKSGDLHSLGKKKGIELSGCFSHNPEAFLSNTPTNQGPKKQIKYHKMDKFSLATIFNHTRSDFHHEAGIVIGRNLSNKGKPVTFDIYDSSHNGYGMVITGTTNAGKSTTVKILMLRYAPFGYRFVSLDTEARGNRGEYSLVAERLNGVNYQIHSKSTEIINLFELDIEKELDEILMKEYETLNLNEKITDVKHIILTMIKGDDNISTNIDNFTAEVVTDTIKELYDEYGIVEGDVDSLYTRGDKYVNGKLTSGKVKKKLPTITDFYKKVLFKKKYNTNPNYDLTYDSILSAMKEYVRHLIICKDCLKEFTIDEYNKLYENSEIKGIVKCPHCEQGVILKLKGTRPYYDGQSTVHIDYYTKHTNIDISQLHDKEKPIAQQIALNFIKENFIKKNSKDPSKAEKLVVLFDETHKMFAYEEARKFIIEVYRTARKRHVSPWTATQRLADYKLYEECVAIITNATAKFILRHDPADDMILKEMAKLTDSQVQRILSLDKGEVCLKDNNNVVFCKIDLLDIEKTVTDTDMGSVRKSYEEKRVG